MRTEVACLPKVIRFLSAAANSSPLISFMSDLNLPTFRRDLNYHTFCGPCDSSQRSFGMSPANDKYFWRDLDSIFMRLESTSGDIELCAESLSIFMRDEDFFCEL